MFNSEKHVGKLYLFVISLLTEREDTSVQYVYSELLTNFQHLYEWHMDMSDEDSKMILPAILPVLNKIVEVLTEVYDDSKIIMSYEGWLTKMYYLIDIIYETYLTGYAD